MGLHGATDSARKRARHSLLSLRQVTRRVCGAPHRYSGHMGATRTWMSLSAGVMATLVLAACHTAPPAGVSAAADPPGASDAAAEPAARPVATTAPAPELNPA